MNKNIIYILLAFILVFTTNSKAEELWELTQPGNANIGQSVFIKQERLGLYVPKSFEGRKVNEDKTNFGFVYSAGGIPCRIEHGGVNLKLVWDIPVEQLDYDPILVTCFEGLLETEHPYNFLGKQCIRELLGAEGAKEKVEPILGKLIVPLKNAIKCDIPEIFCEAMNDLEILSNMLKDKLNPYLHFFLQNINKKSFNIKYKDRVFEILKTLEENGGPEVYKEIKRKIPTYTSI